MPYFNGDRVCVSKTNNNSKLLEFGRIQEYVDVEESVNTLSTGVFSNYGDVLSSDDTLFSSAMMSVSPPLVSSDGGRLLMRRVPVFQLDSTKRKTTELLVRGGDGGKVGDGKIVPGLTSPIMMKRSRSQPDMIGRVDEEDREGERIKRRIIWDNNSKNETELSGDQRDERMYKVIDRKFSVGQSVTSSKFKGMRGHVIEVIPLVSVQVPFCDPENKHEDGHVISDLDISEIKPISPIFSGVTIEFNRWIGQVTEVERRVVYKLQDSTYLTRTFQDSTLIRNSRNAPIPSKSSQEANDQRKIQNHFSYPFMKHTEMPFIGKVERFTKFRLDQLKLEEQEDKENNTDTSTRYTTRSKTGSSSSNSTAPTLTSLCIEQRKRNRADRENFIMAIVESVSIVSIKVRWTGRLPAYLIKLKADASLEKAKRQGARHQEEMPSTFIRSHEDVKKVRPLYINPAMYFEKKGLCAYTTDKKDEEIMIPERLWSYNLYKEAGGEDNRSEVVAPFNLSTVTLSPPSQQQQQSSEEKRKDSMKNTDDYSNGKRKRCHYDQDIARREESSTGDGRRTIIVCKHFVRHNYKVIWDNNESTCKRRSSSARGEERRGESYRGTELYPLTQEHKLCLGLIHSHLYVLPRSSSGMYGHCDYGVVVEKPADDSIVVEWLKIQKDGSVVPVRTLKCEMLDIDKHPKFNELHEGRIVVRGIGAAGKYKASREFSFGTIVAIKRFALGQISVYCPLKEKIIELWPHMVDLFVGMTMQELIAHKFVGVNKKFGPIVENE